MNQNVIEDSKDSKRTYEKQADYALSTLKNQDITELRNMNRPSVTSFNAIKAVMILLGTLDVDLNWENAKKVMANAKQFKQQLSSFNKDNIPEKRIRKVSKITDTEDFASDKTAKSSKAAASLVMWVQAIVNYHRAIKAAGKKL